MSTAQQSQKANKSLVRTDHQTFRSVLLELLNARTQQQTAKVLGVTQPTLSAYLRGNGPRSLPHKSTAQKMARRLHVDVGWFCSLIWPVNKST